MDSKNIIKRLKKDGWFEVNQVGGQKQFRHPTKPGRVTVPRPLDAVMDDPHNRDAVAFLVAAPIQDRTVRVNVAFRQSALDRIDAAAKARGQNRSAFLTEAALARIDA